MRIVLGNALLLAASSLVGLSPSPVAAATGCEAPDTTWVGTSTGSMSWADEANWSHGVPSAESVVCIPDTGAAPEIGGSTAAAANVIDASEATVTLGGDLTVGNSFEVATLVGELGDLHGPGTTTVTDRLSGPTLRLLDLPVVNLTHGAVLDGDVDAWDGSLNVVGDVVLGSARVDSLGGRPFTIAETGSLTLEGGASALIEGGFANHGQVTATSGFLRMLGASPEGLHPEHFSTGTFTGGTGANFWVVGTELRSGARLDHVNWVQGISVPADHTVTAAASSFLGSGDSSTPSLSGAGEVVVTDGSIAEAEIGGSLTVTVPEGEVFVARDSVIQDQAHVQVYGELTHSQFDHVYVEDDALLEVHGVHRLPGNNAVHFGGADPGMEIIRSGGQLLESGDLSVIDVPLVIEGSVISNGWLALDGTPKLADNGSIAGDVTLVGSLIADPGPTGKAFLAGAEVMGSVRVSSGTLDVSQPDPASWADGRLTGGRYVAAHGATLNLPPTTTLAAELRLVGRGASFGAGLDALTSIAPAGDLELLDGADLTTTRGLENRGSVSLSSRSDLDVGGQYSQGRDARLTTQLGAVGRGQVVASGRLDLAGDLVLLRDVSYRPARGTRLWMLRGSSRRGTKFARILRGDPFVGRRFVADYSRPDQMTLRVEAN